MFLEFFYMLRYFKVPVSITEWTDPDGGPGPGLRPVQHQRLLSPGPGHPGQERVLLRPVRPGLCQVLRPHQDRHRDHRGGPGLAQRTPGTAWSWTRSSWPQLQRYDLEKLRQLFEERLKEQTERHDGGGRWVGTGGTSPFGHSGAHPAGVRIGGPGGGGMAIQVAQERRFKNYRTDITLDVRQIKVALRRGSATCKNEPAPRTNSTSTRPSTRPARTAAKSN